MIKRNVDYIATKSHHRPDGFVNRYAGRLRQQGLLRWQWDRFSNRLPLNPQQPILGIQPNLSFIQRNTTQSAVTWVGHATVLLQVDGLNILTDPHWGYRASPVRFMGPKRHQAPGVPLSALPKIDVVLISHNHWDHLDKGTVQSLISTHREIQFFVPLGVQYWFKKHIHGTVLSGPKRNVIALDWDETFRVRGHTEDAILHFLSVQHWSARTLWDRYQTLWGSWALMHPKFRFWFSGDLGYSQDTLDIGKKMGGFDLAAIAIGSYEPRWFMKASHINPMESIQVMQDINATHALGIHWGTFENLSDEPLDQPPKDLQHALNSQSLALDFRVLKHGETWCFS